ncbi:secreted seminal-vesicle Ly-6 protein 1-like isoform X1 [Ursus maritimus]|uniref:Secreted seminal-vesicle Ly-6 protein 1-like isoform X1 n=1 Tax=Ursus maritimus TaxID=29073 RepID=A0A384BVA6_URSMA|nr:secreted seminal-vesicle Ly-6 protein 1-like isoform X1 [Ursus maritimus]
MRPFRWGSAGHAFASSLPTSAGLPVASPSAVLFLPGTGHADFLSESPLWSLCLPGTSPQLLPALQCFQCQRFNASGVCETGKSVCQAKRYQQCFLRKVYKDDILSYGYQGCTSVCFPMTIFNKDVALEEKCCSDSTFCNKF